eukprot:13676742-Alexandrium_andersonii.AAC.1
MGLPPCRCRRSRYRRLHHRGRPQSSPGAARCLPGLRARGSHARARGLAVPGLQPPPLGGAAD